MQFYGKNICQIMIFRLYTVYNKHEMIKIVNQTREKIECIIASARIILLSTIQILLSPYFDTIFKCLCNPYLHNYIVKYYVLAFFHNEDLKTLLAERNVTNYYDIFNDT